MRLMKGVINLKKDRNCGGMPTPYPVYPNMGMPMQGMPMGGIPMQGMQGPLPIGGVNMPMPGPMPAPMPYMNSPMTSGQGFTNTEINTLARQVNSLEQRVSNLENMVGKSSSNYNTSNYQMM